MNKDTKTLPQAIKIIVGKHGKDIVNDIRIVNIMNDVVSLEEPNAVKSILRDVIKQGYGGKILSINTPHDNYHLKVKAFSKEISNSLGYKEVIVEYILYSIAFGVGICPHEPYIETHNTPKRENRSVQSSKKDEGPFTEKRPNRVIAACIFIILLILVFGGFSYWKSSTDREQFERRVFSGNSFMSSGDYVNAVESYKEAYKGYNAINSGSYKEKAIDKIDALTDKLIVEGKTNAKSLQQAYQVIESELQLDLSSADKERLITKKNEIENGQNSLITIISANNGKLDESGKQLLKELIELAPNDYWLNFIKKKSDE